MSRPLVDEGDGDLPRNEAERRALEHVRLLSRLSAWGMTKTGVKAPEDVVTAAREAWPDLFDEEGA